jgi:hypothetical protein
VLGRNPWGNFCFVQKALLVKSFIPSAPLSDHKQSMQAGKVQEVKEKYLDGSVKQSPPPVILLL